MEFTSVPIIVILCYLIGEIYKVVFKGNEKAHKLIPSLLTLLGGLMGVVLYFADQEYLGVAGIVSALEIGLISGSASTGIHQILKQLTKKEN